MQASERRGKYEAIGVGSDLPLDLIGPQATMGELPRRSGGTDVARVQEDHISGCVNRSGKTSPVVVTCHIVLHSGEGHSSLGESGFHTCREVINSLDSRRGYMRFESHPW